MGKYASEVVKQAQSWLGCKESNGTHKAIIDLYNSHKPLARGYKVKYTDEWCATFVSAVAIKLGYTDIIPTECGCEKMIELFQKLGCWVENENRTAKAGDVIFYDWQDSGNGDNVGRSDHVGIVEKVSGNTITVIEGNYNEAVKRRTLKVNGRYIRGYGVPKYDTEPTATPIVPAVTYFKKYTGSSGSIVTALSAIGENSSFAYRCKIATANNIEGYTGTAAQNTKMVSLLKQGYLVRPDSAPAPKVQYYARYFGTTSSIVTALNSLKIGSSFANRKKIAKANGITAYLGTAAQNTKLLNLLKQGKLIKP